MSFVHVAQTESGNKNRNASANFEDSTILSSVTFTFQNSTFSCSHFAHLLFLINTNTI